MEREKYSEADTVISPFTLVGQIKDELYRVARPDGWKDKLLFEDRRRRLIPSLQGLIYSSEEVFNLLERSSGIPFNQKSNLSRIIININRAPDKRGQKSAASDNSE